MKRLFTLLAAVSVLALSGMAQSVITIESGTTGNHLVPFANHNANTWVQSIYGASYIGLPDGGKITAIQYYCSQTASVDASDLTIYMANTTRDTVGSTSAWVPMGSLTQVYHSASFSQPTSTGWFTITLDGDGFDYTGGGLAIVTKKTGGSVNNNQKYYIYNTGTGHNVSLIKINQTSGHPGTSAANTRNVIFPAIKFTVTPNPSCMTPTSVTQTAATSTSASISIAKDPYSYDPTAFELKLVKMGSTDTVTTTTADGALAQTITGLEAGTNYNLSVRAICGAVRSVNAASCILTTACEAKSIPWTWTTDGLTTYAYTAWNGSNTTPACWDFPLRGTGTNPPRFGFTSAPGLVLATNNTTPAIAVLPEMAEPLGSLIWNFSCNFEVDYGYITDASDASSFVQLGTSVSGENNIDLEELGVSFPGSARLAFRSTYDGASVTSVTVTGISVDHAPVCKRPGVVHFESATQTSLTFSWGGVRGDGNTYRIRVVRNGQTDTNTFATGYTSQSVTVGTYNGAPLLSGVNYHVYVDKLCSGAYTAAMHASGTTLGVINATVAPACASMGTVTGALEGVEGSFATITAVPNAGYRFVRWSDENTNASRSIMYRPSEVAPTYLAYFEARTYQVDVVSSNAAYGSVSTSGGAYAAGSTLVATAVPNSGYLFTGWSTGETGTTLNYTVESRNNTITAYFRPEGTVQLMGTLRYDIDGYSISQSPADGIVTAGQSVTVNVTAASEAGYYNTWGGTPTSQSHTTGTTAYTATYTADAQNHIYVFNNTPQPYSLTKSAVGPGEVLGTVATYNYGDTVRAFAQPSANGRFVGWTGTVSSTDNPVEVPVLGNVNLVANFRKDSITVNLSCNEGGTVAINYNSVETSGTSVSRRVAVGEDYIVSASNAPHYSFFAWSTGASASSTSLTATGSDGSTTNVSASFVADVMNITVAANITTDGNSVGGSNSYAYNSPATITATAGAHHDFVRWTLGGSEVSTDASYTFTVLADGAYTAVFSPKQYTVAAVPDNGAHGSVSGAGTYTYGATATLTASANAGWQFTQWSDGNSDNPRSWNVDADLDVTAQYEQIVYHIALEVVGNGSIFNESTIEAANYHYGDIVTLSAVVDDPLTWRFAGWSDGGEQSHSYTVTDNVTLTATFTALDRHAVNVSVNNGSWGTVSGVDPLGYTSLQTAEVRATANDHYRFDYWGGVPDAYKYDNPVRIAMGSNDTAIVANFAPQTYTVSTAVNNASWGTLTGGGAFSYGSTVTLTAVPMPGYKVNLWSNGTSRDFTQSSFTVEGNITVTVSFVPDTFAVSVAAANADVTIKQGTTDMGASGSFAYGTTLSLEATLNEHYTGNGWSDGSTDNPHTVTVGAENAHYVYYTTINQYTINGTPNSPTMGYVTGSATRNALQTTTLVAHELFPYVFVRWDDGETSPSRTEVFTSNRDYVAIFELGQFDIALRGGNSRLGAIGINGTADSNGTFDYGTVLTLRARPNAGVRFTGWSDGSTDTLRTLTLAGNTVLTASWDSIQYRLDTLTNNLAMGHISVSPVQPYYRYGDQVTLSAVVSNASLYRFVGWSDGTSDATHPLYTFGTDEVFSISAIFDEKSRHTISVSSNNDAWGTAAGSATGLVNGSYTISATPLYDYVEFLGWSDNGSLESPRTVVINDNDFISTARFGLRSYTVTSTAANGTVQGAGIHQWGSTVTLYASPAANYVFRQWSNGETANPYTFTMAYDTVVSPVFTLDSVDINIVASNVESTSGSGTYAIGDEVNLSVVPLEHYHVDRWNLNGALVANSVNSIPAFNATANATYVVDVVKDQVTLRVANANPEMGRVDGVQLNTLLSYDYETTINLTAVPNEHFQFVNWTDENGDEVSVSPTYSFDITAATVLTANFSTVPLAVSVSTADALMGSVNSGANGNYVYGDMFTAVATPATGFRFKYWTPGNITANPYAFQVQAATALTAEFELATHTVTAVPNDPAMGSVSRTPSRDSYDYGTVVTLSVSYDPARYRFVSWSNGDTRESFDTTVYSDIEMTAIFNDAFQKNITLFANGNGTVRASAYSVYEGTSVYIVAEPNDTNTYFAGWDNGLTGDSVAIVVTRDTIITATFLPKQRTLTVDIIGNGTVAHEATYAHGTEVTLVAEPAAHVHFVEWEDASTDVRRVVVMDGDQYVGAYFRNDTVRIQASALNGTVSVADTVVDYGQGFALTATANENYSHFHGWTRNGVAIGGDETITVDATADGIYLATFAIDTVSLVVDVNDQQMGSVTGAISGSYTYGTEVNLTAVPAANHHFVNWNGNELDTDPVVTNLALTAPVTIMVANFELDSFDVLLSVDAIYGFGSVQVEGGRSRFGHGEQTTLVATPDAEMYRFVRWSDGNTEANRTITVTGDVDLTAYFDTVWYNASITSNNPAKGRVDGAKNRYFHGETMHVEAVVLGGNVNRFTGWSNGSTSTVIDSVVTSNIVLTAIFDDANRYSVFVSSNNTAWGSVSGSGSYNEGDDVTITATPAAHYHLWYWSDDPANSDLSRTIDSIHADFMAVANFRLDSHYVDFEPAIENGLLLGNAWYNYGSTVSVIAVPAEHYRLAYWTINGVSVSTDSIYTFRVDSNVVLGAVFELKNYTVTATAQHGSIVSGAGSYTALTPATIIAQADPNYYFLRWIVDGVNVDTVATDTLVIPSVDHNTNVVAVYGISDFSFTFGSNDEDKGDAIATVDGVYTFGGTYHNGATVVMTARKRSHTHFVAWMDATMTDTISTDNPFTFELTADTALTAVFADDLFAVTALSADSNMGTTTGSGEYPYLSLVTVTALPAEGYHFTQWSDGVQTAERYVYVTDSVTLTAFFAINTYTVSVTVDNPAMGSVSGSGVYNWGDTATIVARANNHFEFLGFNDGPATEDSISFVVYNDTTITARFDHHYIRLYTAADHGSVSTTVEGGNAGALMPILTRYNDTVVVNAVADSHYHFISWIEYSIAYDTVYDTVMVFDHRVVDTAYDTPDGDHIIVWDSIFREEIREVVSQNLTEVNTYDANPYGFRILGDTYMQANFAPDTYSVVLYADNALVAGEGRYVYGDSVTVAAVCDSHYHFVAWALGTSDTVNAAFDTVSTDNPYTFAIESDISLVALTALDQFTLTLTASEGGVVLGAGVYEYGAVATITAMADSGYYFYGWSDGDTSAMRQITITSDTAFSAVFYRVGIDDVDADDVKVYATGTTIHVEGAAGRQVRVFDAVGRQVATTTAVTDDHSMTVGATGLYLVQVGNKPARRVMVMR